jgi:hypothetical protein
MPLLERKVAVIDLDGVVARHWLEIQKRLLAGGHGVVVHPRTDGLLEMDPKVREEVFALFQRPDFYEKLLPHEGAIPALYDMAEDYELCYLSSRPCDGLTFNWAVAEVTLAWIAKWDLPIGKVMFAPSADKGGHCRSQYGIERIAFAVDDREPCVRSYWKAGIFTYVVDYPHNRSLVSDNMMRVTGLRDVAAHRRSARRIH